VTGVQYYALPIFDFDGAVIELIGDEDVAGLVEFAGLPLKDASQQQNSHAAQ
jgi:hypothetical protein